MSIFNSIIQQVKKNKPLVILLGITVVFYYRVLKRTVMMVEADRIDALLHFSVLFLFAVLVFSRNGKLQLTRLAKIVLYWMVLNILTGVACMVDLSEIIHSVLWSVYFIIPCFCVKSDDDFRLMRYVIVIISVLSIGYSFVGLQFASVYNNLYVSTADKEAWEVVNMVAFSIITIPVIMTLKNDILRWTMLIAILIVVLLSGRRIASVCIIMAILIMTIQTFFASKGKKVPLIYKALVIFAVGYGIYFLLRGNMSIALESTLSRFQGTMEDGGSSRDVIWKDVMNAMSNNNILQWVFGHGYLGVMADTGHTAAHNEFLEIIFDYGIVGLIMYIYLHLNLIRRCRFLLRIKHDYSMSYLMSYLIFLIYALFGNVLLYPEYVLSLSIYWGAIEGLVLTGKIKNTSIGA